MICCLQSFIIGLDSLTLWGSCFQDKVVTRIEERISAWTFIPKGNFFSTCFGFLELSLLEINLYSVDTIN